MASIGKDKRGKRVRYRVLFVAEDGSRKTIRLGNASQRQAEAFKVKVEDLIGRRYAGGMDDDTARWLADLPEDIYAKLVAVGLVDAREAKESASLGPFIDSYIESRVDLKARTRTMMQQTRRALVAYFGEQKPLADIHEGDAELWRLDLIGKGLAGATVAKRCGHAKQFFARALRQRLIDSNPFAPLPSASKPNPARMVFISHADIEKVIDACPDTQWKLIFALARYGGLRCPSEVLSLQWQDINWEQSRMLIRSPKTERHAGGESRLAPIFPELRPILMDAFEEAEPGTKHVVTRYRTQSTNLRTQAHRIIKRAGLKPWTRTFQNLRSSRETELTERFPLHVVTQWIGNSQLIAAKHYLQVRDEDFEKAIQVPTSAAQNAAQQAHASSAKTRIEPQVPYYQNGVFQPETAHCELVHTGAQPTDYPREDSNL